jgi:hypothetical protein
LSSDPRFSLLRGGDMPMEDFLMHRAEPSRVALRVQRGRANVFVAQQLLDIQIGQARI